MQLCKYHASGLSVTIKSRVRERANRKQMHLKIYLRSGSKRAVLHVAWTGCLRVLQFVKPPRCMWQCQRLVPCGSPIPLSPACGQRQI